MPADRKLSQMGMQMLRPKAAGDGSTMTCTTHHICDCKAAEIDALKDKANEQARDYIRVYDDSLKLRAEIQTFADAWNELETLQALLREAREHLNWLGNGQTAILKARIDAALGQQKGTK
jgi:hypothetical protein